MWDALIQLTDNPESGCLQSPWTSCSSNGDDVTVHGHVTMLHVQSSLPTFNLKAGQRLGNEATMIL